MVVSNDQRGSIASQGQLHDFARVDAGSVDGSSKELFESDNSVAIVEQEAGKHFVRIIAQPRLQKVASLIRAAQGLATLQSFPKMPPTHFKNSLQLGIFCWTQALMSSELLQICFE